MDNSQIQSRLGLGAIALSAFLILYGIPGWVSAPSNVSNVILSPLFWPYVLAGLTGVIGLALLWTGARQKGQEGPLNDPIADPGRGYLRLAVMGAIMLAIVPLLSWLGMVWTSMLAFIATAALVRTRHPITAAVCAVLVPLLLYIFFAHVAGVAIPQGEFVRLP